MHDRAVTGGVDTHSDVHVAAVIDETGRVLGVASFPAERSGYARMLRWWRSFGELARVGIEGTGAYGAGLARFLATENVAVVEVDRPNRQWRRRRGKSDTVDAEAAARAALNGDATGAPKAGAGLVECIRVLRLTRRSAIKARTQTANQIRDVVVTAPEDLRARLRDASTTERVEVCARLRPKDATEPSEASKLALRTLARRHQALTSEIEMLDRELAELCRQANPALLASKGVGAEVCATLLVTAGDNPERMRSETAFAALCGVSPIEASSGKVVRHRLNTGGDRSANNALWRVALVRMSIDPATKDYVDRRTKEGKSKREIIRCLKRYIAREVFTLLVNPPDVPLGSELRTRRLNAGHTLADVATALRSWPIRISRIERGLDHDAELARRYGEWLTPRVAA